MSDGSGSTLHRFGSKSVERWAKEEKIGESSALLPAKTGC